MCKLKTMTTSFVAKYKPYYIDEYSTNIHLMSVVKTLLTMNDLNILFIGSPGSGKTTLLYALIREYYNLNKTDHINENNIMFINNLKEQGINYYRSEMKTFCQSHCNTFCKKKMIVIDDLDCVNEQSQQVFRNCIDKYKNNVNFITVCTNIHKVIESIQSRLHILLISNVTDDYIRVIMKNIIMKEGMTIDDVSKEYLVQYSNKSIRVLMNSMEKLHLYGKPIHIELCKKMCSNISFHLFEEYLIYLKQGELNKSIQKLYDIYDHGFSVIDILDFFFTFIKNTNLITEEEKYQIIPLLCEYITVFHNVHEDMIELALFTNDICNILNKSPLIGVDV